MRPSVKNSKVIWGEPWGLSSGELDHNTTFNTSLKIMIKYPECCYFIDASQHLLSWHFVQWCHPNNYNHQLSSTTTYWHFHCCSEMWRCVKSIHPSSIRTYSIFDINVRKKVSTQEMFDMKTVNWPQSPVDRLDPAENHSAALLLNPAAGFYSDPALWDGRSWTSEQRPANHSWPLTTCSQPIWIKNKWWRVKVSSLQLRVLMFQMCSSIFLCCNH